MFTSRLFRLTLLVLCVVVTTVATLPCALAKARLMTLSDGVVAYSGPGEYYRPLAVFPARTQLKAGSTPIQTKDGAFYKVIVKLSEKKSVIGYVSVRALATFVADKLEEDDLSKYGDVALVSKAAQLSFSTFRDQASLFTAGYMKYLSPGFYIKGFGGRFMNTQANATTLGGEVGNDAVLLGRISGVVSYDLGLFIPSQSGLIFESSSQLNAMMQAGFGLRYNFGGVASMSALVSQAVFFNGNNSLVTSGATVTLEVGL